MATPFCDACELTFKLALDGLRSHSCLQEMKEEDRDRIRRARSFDTARYRLPGNGLMFDFYMDIGSTRDLIRHRRCKQIPRPR